VFESRKVVSSDAWVAARKELLAKEKEFNRLRDELSRQRRDLPWERVDKNYIFKGPSGDENLSQLFAGRSQLIVYHFMFDPNWEAGCKSCSFWADSFNGVPIHLNERDVTFVVVSRAPLPKLDAYKKRMGWSFKWVSSFGSDFNRDFHVSFTPEEVAKDQAYLNYRIQSPPATEGPGFSVFHKDSNQDLFHTYSTYSRGIDMMNVAYHLLDLVPKGRDEGDLPKPQFWVRRHDEYDR
jgi:predicted dithiol-disulfide oxidoreductase (DUF899 family)